MKFLHVLSLSLIYFGITVSMCKGQGEHFYITCFDSKAPKTIILPESFNFSKKKLFANFSVICFYDSTGKVLGFKPFSIFIKQKKDKLTVKSYHYYTKESLNMGADEAYKIQKWIINQLINLVEIKRTFHTCNQVITNYNSMSIDFLLE